MIEALVLIFDSGFLQLTANLNSSNSLQSKNKNCKLYNESENSTIYIGAIEMEIYSEVDYLKD